MKAASWGFGSALGLLGLTVVVLLPRALEHVSRADLWYQRSIRFYEALGNLDWASTYQQYHPGVTTMWISGGTLALFRGATGTTPEELLAYEVDGTAVGVAGLAVAIPACLLGAVVILRTLFGAQVAWIAGGLIVFDPFLLTSSKVLHVDALLACFVLLSVLALLLYQRAPSLKRVALVGVFSGLALLTKSPALLLLPLCAAGIAFAQWDRRDGGPSLARVRRVVGHGLVLVAVLGAVITIGFPAMWVEPLEVVDRVIGAVFLHADRPHTRPIYFWGSTSQDPGLLYYPVVTAYRMTSVSLPMALVGAGIALFGLGKLSRQDRISLLTIIAFIAVLTAAMAASDKKSQRYILPTLPLLDVLAASGIAALCAGVSRFSAFKSELSRAVLAACFVAVPAAIVLSHHPFYGLHANRLLGGPAAADWAFALQDQVEGAGRAAEYLNAQPGAKYLNVAALGAARDVIGRTFDGELGFKNPDYRVYFHQPFQRGLAKPAWERCRARDDQHEPVWALTVDGVRFTWIHRVRPENRDCRRPRM